MRTYTNLARVYAVFMDPARSYARVLGWLLLVIGLLGFLPTVGGTLGSGSSNLLGIFPINNVHNVVHIVTGLLGVFAGYYRSGVYARTYALTFGVVYALVTILGFVVAPGGPVGYLLGLIPLNIADNLLHLLIALGGIAVYFLTSPARPAAPRAV